MKLIYKITFYLLLSLFGFVLHAENKVTTYITVTQEERRSTQFNLTEWLKIQERIKMMDLYMAMFSNPKEDRFQLELSLMYGRQLGTSKQSGDLAIAGQSNKPVLQNDFAKIQVWLTNIISHTFGIRTLNVDLGIEAFSYLPESPGGDKIYSVAGSRYQSLDLRFFGKNIQDSSFVLKYGTYLRSDYASGQLNSTTRNVFAGTFAGLELQLYLLHWLGMEGNYYSFQKAENLDLVFSGTQFDYGAYIEISLFRLMFGAYQAERNYRFLTKAGKDSEVGTFAALKLQL